MFGPGRLSSREDHRNSRSVSPAVPLRIAPKDTDEDWNVEADREACRERNPLGEFNPTPSER